MNMLIFICWLIHPIYAFHPASSKSFMFKRQLNPNYPTCIQIHPKDSICIASSKLYSSNSDLLELTDDGNEMVIDGMPNRVRFEEYYKKTVSGANVMKKATFLQYDQVQSMISDYLVFNEDIDELWVSAIGDSTGLDSDEAYEMLCMVFDLPDPEDIQYMDTEFKLLTKNKPDLTFSKFLMWQDIQDILTNEALSMEDVTNLWRQVAKDLNTPINSITFRKLNHLLDVSLEDNEESAKAIDVAEAEDTPDKIEDPLTFFDFETLTELKVFFESQMSPDRKISFESLVNWSDIKGMIKDGVISSNDVEKAWKEVSKGEQAIEYDEYLNFNVRLDLMMEPETPKTENVKKINNDESELFYRNEFKRLMGGGALMPISILLDWNEMIELIQDNVLSEKQIETLFNSMAEPIGIPSTSMGISIDNFVKLNRIIDSSVESSSAPSSTENAKKMDAFQSLPLSAQNDLLNPSNETATESELELMKLLDSADNLLNAGSFGDYSTLIGDDVPLINKELLGNKKNGQGDIKTDLESLVNYAKQQGRCGLDTNNEADSNYLFDLFQKVLSKTTPLVSYDLGDIKMKLNGNWKMLYTNSEMFRFYGGLTGFNNVFPATKFDSLSLEYSTDGFLNELKYKEILNNPFGKLEAVAYGNWDMVKETSFMTNEVSVIMRAYCTKVTAGIATYEAQENWKSLRTLSMNELVYIDDDVMIMRNCGALRIFFVLVKT